MVYFILYWSVFLLLIFKFLTDPIFYSERVYRKSTLNQVLTNEEKNSIKQVAKIGWILVFYLFLGTAISKCFNLNLGF